VLGSRDQLPRIALKEKIDEILIAIPSLSEGERFRIMALCEETGKRYRVMQSLAKSVLG